MSLRATSKPQKGLRIGCIKTGLYWLLKMSDRSFVATKRAVTPLAWCFENNEQTLKIRNDHQEIRHVRYVVTMISVLITICAPIVVQADSVESAEIATDKPFVLIARLHAVPNAAAEVLRLSKAADQAVKASEPGMLIHTFDQDPSDPSGFVWTEVYADSAALIFHLQNPPLQKYLSDVSPLLDSFTVELYGDVSARAVNMLRSTGTPTAHYKTQFGYVRDLAP